jgi:TolB protein
MRLKLTVIGALAAAGLAAGLLVGVASATYPGTNNGRLAFAMNVGGNVDIYSVLPNGNDFRRLTDDPSFDAGPAYSPSGKEVAFNSNRSGSFEIWKMKQNGTQQEQVTHLGGRVLFPDFSPDGSKILFSGLVGSDAKSDLYTVNGDGSGLVQLTSGAGNNNFGVWSPDGSKIAFISDRTGFDGVWVMKVMNATAAAPRS